MKIYWIVLLIFLGSHVKGTAAVQDGKETFLFAVRGADSLYLDKYEGYGTAEYKPCILFMFGGGFVGGQRDAQHYKEYFHYLREQGYTVIAPDYRLGLKGITNLKEKPLEEVAALITKSVAMAVEDLYAATEFVLLHAGEWHIDAKNMIANGSSAGAIAVLQAEYWICNQNPLAAPLPAGFNYAGILSFAGAIFDRGTELQWKKKPVPILLFHGSADNQVPYARIGNENIGAFGSAYIAGQLSAMQVPYYFYDVENAGHELAGDPMYQNRETIEIFLNQLVRQKEPLMIHTTVQVIGRKAREKKFGIGDYLH